MRQYLRVARLPFLVPGMALYLLGGFWALQQGGNFSLLALVIGYLVVLPAQLSVHFSNDYFDSGTDSPGHSTPISGGGGVLFDHPELRTPVKGIAVVLIVLSISMGMVFIWMMRLPAWTFGIVALGNLIGWFYSAPPLRFSQRGIGEWCFPLLGGFFTPAGGYLALHGRLVTAAWYLVLPLLIYTLISVLAVEIPDEEADLQGQKFTWVVRHGRSASFVMIGLLMLAASMYFAIWILFFPPMSSFRPWVAGFISLLPLSVGLVGMVLHPADQDKATRLAVFIVGSLTAFSLLMDGYLIWLTTL